MNEPPASLWTLAELAATAAKWRGRLVGAKAWDRVRAIPCPLPAVFSVGGLECRLRDGDERVDFHGCILRDAGHEALRSWLDVGQDSLSDAKWSHLSTFLHEWTARGSGLRDAVAATWLEFDLDGDEPRSPFAIATLLPPWKMAEPWTRQHTAEVVDAIVTSLAANSDTAPARELVRHCVLELPPSSYVAHVAVPARTGHLAVRLILNLPWRNLSGYLRRIGSGFDGGEVDRWLDSLCTTSVVHAFHLDVAAGIGARLSCEFSFDASPRKDPRWTRLLDRLVDRGSCAADKRGELIEWWTDGGEDTGEVAAKRDFLLKVDYGTLETKAYLPFYPLDLNRPGR